MRFLNYLLNPEAENEFVPGENQRFLMDLVAQEKSEAAYKDKRWKIWDREQNARNRDRRRAYGMPRAKAPWSPKPDGSLPALPPLSVTAAPANVSHLPKRSAKL